MCKPLSVRGSDRTDTAAGCAAASKASASFSFRSTLPGCRASEAAAGAVRRMAGMGGYGHGARAASPGGRSAAVASAPGGCSPSTRAVAHSPACVAPGPPLRGSAGGAATAEWRHAALPPLGRSAAHEWMTAVPRATAAGSSPAGTTSLRCEAAAGMKCAAVPLAAADTSSLASMSSWCPDAAEGTVLFVVVAGRCRTPVPCCEAEDLSVASAAALPPAEAAP